MEERMAEMKARYFAPRIVLVGVVLLASVLASTHEVLAQNWYAGNGRDNTYGIRANIQAPAGGIYLAQDGESNWVSTAYGDWIQAGWRYYVGYSVPRPYVEVVIGGSYDLDEYGTQSWGTAIEYRVEYDGSSTWNAYIDGTHRGGFGPHSVPRTVFALSEVHNNSANELNTQFSYVKYRNSSYNWVFFDQNKWIYDAPYSVTQSLYYQYRTYGP